MYGRVTRYFQNRGYGFIYGEDSNTYFIHRSNLQDEYLDNGYYVHFTPFQNDRSDYNAKNVIVINAPERKEKEKNSTKNKKKHRKHKSCNADKITRDNKKFQKFVQNFLCEQKALNEERGNDGKIN